MVAQPVIGVVLHPVDVLAVLIAENGIECGPKLTERGRDRNRGRQEDDRGDALGVLGRHEQSPPRAVGERDQARGLRGGVVHDRQAVGGKDLVGVRGLAEWAVGESVAASVHRQHAAVSGQVRDLAFPEA